jgi:hypothetical protein
MSTPPLSARKLIHSILLSKGRMEGLTDGIFAIAMTLLVLELKIPDLPKSASASELLHKIGEGNAVALQLFDFISLLWAAVGDASSGNALCPPSANWPGMVELVIPDVDFHYAIFVRSARTFPAQPRGAGDLFCQHVCGSSPARGAMAGGKKEEADQ